MSERSDSLQLLLSFDKTISWPETKKVAAKALGFFQNRFNFDQVSITLINTKENRLDIFTLDESTTGSFKETQLKLTEAALENVSSNYIPDFSKKRSLTSAEKKLQKQGIQSYLVVPLFTEDEVVGSLNIGSKTVAGIDLTSQDILKLLSSRLALALYHATLHDELKANQQALITSEKSYRHLIDQAADAILKCSPKGAIIQANRTASQVLGYSQEELLSSNISSLFSSDTLKQKPLRYDLLKHGFSVIAERNILHKDGTSFPVETNSKNIDDGGAFLVILRDLRERNESKENLIARDNQINALLNAVPAPLYAIDNDGKYVLLNDSYLKFFGKKKEDLLGKTVQECWPKDLAERFEEDDRLLMEKNERQSYSILLNNAKGEQRLTQVSKARYTNSLGEVAGFIGALWDYTELKTAEERYQKLFTFSPEPIVVHDGKSLLTANQAAEKFFGAERPEDYLGAPLSRFIHPDSLQGARKRVEALVTTKKANKPTQQKFLTAQGEIRDVEVKSIFLVYESRPVIMSSFRDITEEKRNLALLEASEENYRNLIEANPNPVVVHIKQRVVYANRAALDFVGGEKLADYMGRDVLDFVHKDSKKMALDNLAKIDATGTGSPPGEQKYIGANGEPRNVESRGLPVLYRGEKAIMVSFFDTTDQIEARSALQESRRQLELITDHVTHFIVLLDFNLILLYANQSCADWFGFEKDAFIGKNLAEIFDTPGLEATKANLPKVIDGQPCSFPYSFKSRTYDSYDFWVTLIPVVDSSGEVIAILAQAEDITKREMARKELADNKELLELIIDTIPGLFSYTDSSEHYLFVNQTYADWHKKDKSDIVGKKLEEILPVKAYREIRPRLKDVLKGKEQAFTRELIDGSGTQHIFDVKYIPHFDSNNQVKAFLTSLQNVTESKQAESHQKTLRDLAHDLNDSTSMISVGQKAAKAIRSFFGSDAFAIEYFDNDKEVILGVYSEDTLKEGEPPVEVIATDTPFSKVRADFFTANSKAHVRNRTPEQLKTIKHNRPFGSGRFSHSLLFAPINWEGNHIGVLNVQSYSDNKYSAEDLPSLQTFADQIGSALMRTRKDEELQAKKTELQESEEKYRSIIENAGDAVFVSSLGGEILAFNQNATESLGYSEDELFKVNLNKINPEFEKELSRKQLAKLSRSQTSTTIQTTHVRKDNTSFPVELRVGTMELQGKQSILYFARDVSERMDNEVFREALRKIARELTVSLKPREVGMITARVLHVLFGHDTFVLYNIEPEARLAYTIYGEDTFPENDHPTEVELKGTPLDLFDKTIVMLLPRPLLINRKKGGPSPKLSPFGDVSRRSKSLVFVPVFWGGKQIGLFTLQSYTAHKFSNDDVNKLKIFADQIGGAIARAQTHAELLIQTEELQKREQQLKITVGEKEVLLKEVYHRTKNNMQVITGLLEMHGYKTKNKQTLSVLQEMINRITSMSLVHDLLYRSKSLAEIKLDSYLKKLVSRLITAYQTSAIDVELAFTVEPIPVNIQFAIPLGLVINEMVSNALKHAFPASRQGRLSIIARSWQEKGLELIISDNGVGLDKNFVFSQSDTLGMRIIQDIIALQLEGELEIKTTGGVEYQIKIPDLQLGEKV